MICDKLRINEKSEREWEEKASLHEGENFVWWSKLVIR